MSDLKEEVIEFPHGVCPDTEMWIPLPNGTAFVFPHAKVSPEGCDYVRIVHSDGCEQVYWDSEEWKQEPAFVMGAICGCMLRRDDLLKVPEKYYQFGPHVTFPEGVKYTPYGGTSDEINK
jgi:hypothetical protein